MNKLLSKAAQAEQKENLTWLLLFSLALIWGSSFILIKRGLEVFSPIQLAAIRVSAAFLILLIPAFYHLRRLGWQRIPWAWLLLSGLLGIMLPAFLFGLAQTHVSSSTAGILNALTPVFTFLVGCWLFGAPFRGSQLIGTIVGFTGALGLMLTHSAGKLSIDWYTIPILLATVFYGINANLVKKRLSHLPPTSVATLSLLSLSPFSLSLLWFTRVPAQLWHGNEQTWQAFAYLFLLGTLSTAIASVLFYILVQRASAVFASSVTYLIPVVAILWGIADGEAFGWIQLFGISAIVAGIVLIRKGS